MVPSGGWLLAFIEFVPLVVCREFLSTGGGKSKGSGVVVNDLDMTGDLRGRVSDLT